MLIALSLGGWTIILGFARYLEELLPPLFNAVLKLT